MPHDPPDCKKSLRLSYEAIDLCGGANAHSAGLIPGLAGQSLTGSCLRRPPCLRRKEQLPVPWLLHAEARQIRPQAYPRQAERLSPTAPPDGNVSLPLPAKARRLRHGR